MENIPQGKNKNTPVHLFILGTGRSGTQSAAQLLSTLSGCCVTHEKKPQLLQEGADYLSGKMAKEDIVDLLRLTRNVEALGGTRLSGESNLRLSFVLPALAEAFPEARYLWMVRDGRHTVSSYVHREYYHPRYRFKQWELQADQIGEMSAKEWSRINAFARCCWFWSYTNRTIQREAKQLNLNIHLCKIEDFDNELHNIFSFLGLEDQVPQRAPKVDVSSRYKLPWQFWSPHQRAIFKELAGTVMDEHYPGWSEKMEVSLGQELNAFLHRQVHGFSSLVRSATRPLRKKLGLVKKR